MRRNLRLDWRALALLGALLSIIIDWPVLVYAMPTILPPAAAAAVASSSAINVIKNDKVISFLPTAADYEYGDDSRQQHYAKPNEFTMDHSNSDLTQRPISYATTERTNNGPAIKPAGLTKEEQKQKQQQQQAVNENYNSISDNHTNNQNISLTEEHVIYKIPQNSYQLKGEKKTNESSTNTHIENSMDVIANRLIDSSTTESSAKIQSTLMPPTLIENANDDQQELKASFQFSSSNHLAILSRTERSIRSSTWSSSSMTNAKSLLPVNGSGGMLRRSPDVMGVMKSKRLNNSRNLHHKNNLDRNERSTVSHLSGPSRKIQLYIKNRFIQLMPDGTVNGTQDEQCEYTILQRSTVEVGRIKIQGVATCLYLCMDPCGAVYGSQDFTDDCVFNESMEQHNYNTYSSTYNSNARRKYYLALNRHGEPRKLQIPPNRSLGKLATYTNAITESVPQERVEQLIAKNFGANRIKHGIRQLCDTGKPLIELIDSKNFKALPKCNPNSSSSSSSTSSNSNSNSFSSVRNTSSNSTLNLGSLVDTTNSNGQLLNNVPAANDKNSLSNCSRSSSSSSSKPETNSNNSSQSSISNSQNNGHISNSISCMTKSSSNSSSNSPTTSTTTTTTTTLTNSRPIVSDHRGGGKKKNKKRKCRPFENEEEHNCKASLKRPQSMKLGPKKCRDILMQQQQAGVIDIILPPVCNKKIGPKRQKGNKKPTAETRGKNGLGTDGSGPNNRRGKKLNMNNGGGGGGGVGRQAAKQNQSPATGNKKNKKNPKRGSGHNNNKNNNNNNKKKQKTSTTTTEKTSPTTTKSSLISTLRPNFWESTSLLPSTTIYESFDPQAESTSDRGDREQRNVRYSNSMEDDSMEQSSEDTSAPEEQDDEETDLDNADDNEEASYEDDTFVATSSAYIPYKASESSHTPLTGGADDFLYYDQLDFLPVVLWELIAVLWFVAWSLQLFS